MYTFFSPSTHLMKTFENACPVASLGARIISYDFTAENGLEHNDSISATFWNIIKSWINLIDYNIYICRWMGTSDYGRVLSSQPLYIRMEWHCVEQPIAGREETLLEGCQGREQIWPYMVNSAVSRTARSRGKCRHNQLSNKSTYSNISWLTRLFMYRYEYYIHNHINRHTALQEY